VKRGGLSRKNVTRKKNEVGDGTVISERGQVPNMDQKPEPHKPFAEFGTKKKTGRMHRILTRINCGVKKEEMGGRESSVHVGRLNS